MIYFKQYKGGNLLVFKILNLRKKHQVNILKKVINYQKKKKQKISH